MAEQTSKPSMDGIRPARSVDGVVGGSVAPQAQPEPTPAKLRRKQVAEAPVTAPQKQNAQPVEQQARPRKRGAGRKVLIFIISFLIIAAALAGIYWIYLNFYA